MLNDFYSRLGEKSPAAVIIISIALMLLGGFLMTRITKKMKLPNVTAYILTGILMGPYCLDAIPENVVKGTEFLADIALAFVAFGIGEFFRFSKIRKSIGKVSAITATEALLSSLLVFIFAYFVLKLNWAFSLLLSSLAVATAPTSTAMTIRQTKAKGDFVDTLLQVMACDDILALLLFSVMLSVAGTFVSGKPFSFMNILLPVGTNLGAILLGAGFGWLMKLFIQKKRSTDNRLIISVALLFAFCGICEAMGVSPLLGCLSMGTVYINITEDDKLFKQLNYFSPPILLLFFVRSGVSFDLQALLHPSGSVSGLPLLVVGIGYFLVRILGKYVGSYFGCLLALKNRKTRTYLGLALIPQAGVTIGLAALGSRMLGGEMGNALETVILMSGILYELVGPGLAKLALYLSGSYSNKLEDLVEVEEVKPMGEKKTSVELLIDRIEKIQVDLANERKNEEESEEEHAFTEAALHQLEELTKMK